MSCNNKESPEWYVIIENVNAKKIEKYNVFNHASFLNDCDKAWKDNHKDHENGFAKFEESVRRSLMYYFWSKCEWEILVYGFPYYEKFRPKKIDAYDQVTMNWNNFINYLWRYYKYDTPVRVLNR